MRRTNPPSVLPEIRTAAHYAHDLRNLLATVLGHAELQLERLAPELADAELGRSLRAIQLTGSKAAALCQDMMAELERGGAPPRPPERFPLAEVARSAAELLQACGGGKLQVDLDGAEEVEVLASRPSVERAVLNLLWNAYEASLGLAVERVRVRTRWGRDHEGPWLEVADHGPGLPEGRLGDLTEAFRSRRGPRPGGGARGLGLSVVQETMRRCGGRLHGRNAPGGGAVLVLRFPDPEARAAAVGGGGRGAI